MRNLSLVVISPDRPACSYCCVQSMGAADVHANIMELSYKDIVTVMYGSTDFWRRNVAQRSLRSLSHFVYSMSHTISNNLLIVHIHEMRQVPKLLLSAFRCTDYPQP